MIESLDVAVVPAIAAARDPVRLAVVIDVLRATSTIVAALENGAAGVIPCRDTDEARLVSRRLGRERTRLAGEHEAKAIEGFDLDNSPASFTPEKVAGKTIIMATTNGTKALVEAARGKGEVFCAALVNRAAVAYALAESSEETALVVCAGTDGALSFEDTLCAGSLVDALLQLERHLQISDAARVALTLWQAFGSRVTTAMASSVHAKTLVRSGFSADIAACARLDVSKLVPRYFDGLITPRAAAQPKGH